MKTVIEKRGYITVPENMLFDYCAWPSVCTDENGTVYVVCSGMRMAHICPFGRVLLYKSKNNGDSWSMPSVVFDSSLDDRDAGITYLGNGRFFITSFRHPSEVYQNDYFDCIMNDSGKAGTGILEMFSSLEEEKRKGGSFAKISEDYCFSVGKEMRIPVSSPHGPVVLKDGSLFYLGKEMYSYGQEKEGVIASYISRDGGKTFIRAGEVPQPDNLGLDRLHEPHCIQTDDNSIIGFIRTHPEEPDHSFTVYKTFSYDFGKNWSKPEATGICGSPPHALGLPDGKILLSYGRRIQPYGINASIVSSKGDIIGNEIHIDSANDSDIGYPASALLKNGSILTVYYKRDNTPGGCKIMFTRWHFEKEDDA